MCLIHHCKYIIMPKGATCQEAGTPPRPREQTLLILLASLSRISVRCGWSPEVNPSDIRIELRGMRTRNPHCFLALNAEPGVRRTVRSTVSRTRSGPSELGGRARIPMQRNFPAPIPLLLRPAAGFAIGCLSLSGCSTRPALREDGRCSWHL